jgi:hypothetical protein
MASADPALIDDEPAGIWHRRYGRAGYAYKIDGLKVPGVTTITGRFLIKDSPLANWPARMTREYAINHWETLSELPPAARLNELVGAQYGDRAVAAVSGTEVHAISARLAVAPPGTEIEVPDELYGHVESCGDFLDRTEAHVVASELVIANRTVRYCGRLDLIADLGPIPWEGTIIPASRWLLDLKTGASGIWPESALQLCGYEHAEVYLEDGEERPMESLGIQRCGAVHLRGDGWDLIPVETGPDTWTTFRYLAWLFHHEEDRKEWVGSAAGPFPLSAAIPA